MGDDSKVENKKPGNSNFLKFLGIPIGCCVLIGALLASIPSIIFLFLYRNFVFVLSKFILGAESKMLSRGDHVVAFAGVYERNMYYTAVNVIVEGRLSRETLIAQWDKRITRKSDKNGKPMFAEFTFYVRRLLGYSFYLPEKNFNLENHIRVYKGKSEDSIVDSVQLDKIGMKILKELFKRKQSPWEIIIVNNYRRTGDPSGKEHSVMIVKYHHVLGDGYATLMVLWKGLGGANLQPLAAQVKGQNFLANLLIRCKSHLVAIKLFSRFFFYAFCKQDKFYNVNSWKNPVDADGRELVQKCLKPIPSTMIKEISKANDVTITTAIYAVFYGGFKRMMEAKNIQTPKSVRVLGGLVLPNHPDRLTNHSSATYWDVPLIGADPKKLMQKADRNFKEGVMACMYAAAPFFPLVSILPLAFKINRYLYDRTGKENFTLFVTSVPVPSTEVAPAGCPLVQIYSTPNRTSPYITAIMSSLKFKDSFYLSIGIQKNVLSTKEEIHEIEKYIFEELNHLHDLATV